MLFHHRDTEGTESKERHLKKRIFRIQNPNPFFLRSPLRLCASVVNPDSYPFFLANSRICVASRWQPSTGMPL